MEWSAEDKQYLRSKIRDVKDFKPGIIFYDITTLLGDAKAFGFLLDKLAKRYENYQIDYVVESNRAGLFWVRRLLCGCKKALCRCAKKASCPLQP